MNARLALLASRLTDRRGRRVIFVSHCLLNENTRYLGGAFRPAAVSELVERCLAEGIGLVQLPCPEQQVWGGVLKRRLLAFYGAGPLASRRPALWIALRWVRHRYRRLARQVAAQIDDYIQSGFEVVAVAGIDGSPSCGVNETVEIDGFMREAALIDPAVFSADAHNTMVFKHLVPGRGIFIEELAAQLRKRGLDVPLIAHSLRREAAGLGSELTQRLRSSPVAASPRAGTPYEARWS